MGLIDKAFDVSQGAVIGVHTAVISDVITVVTARRRVERQQPHGVDTQIGNVIEFADQAGKVANTVVVGVEKRFDVHLVNHRILVPERVIDQVRRCTFLCHWNYLLIHTPVATGAALKAGLKRFDAPDTERLLRGIKPRPLMFAVPGPAMPRHQVFASGGGVIGQAHLPQG